MISPNPYLDSLFNKFLVEVQENPALGTILHENKNSYSTKLQIAKFAKINESLKKKNPVIYAGIILSLIEQARINSREMSTTYSGLMCLIRNQNSYIANGSYSSSQSWNRKSIRITSYWCILRLIFRHTPMQLISGISWQRCLLFILSTLVLQWLLMQTLSLNQSFT